MAERVTLSDLHKLARRAFRDDAVEIGSYQLPTGCCCFAANGVGQISGKGKSKPAARRELLNLLHLLAGDGDKRAIDALEASNPNRVLSPAERFQLYKRGLRDGVGATVVRHPDFQDYLVGYENGRATAGAHLMIFASVAGYDIRASVLRGEESDASNG